jgi:outer membrane usher protein
LLSKGLQHYSYELRFVRQDFGIKSNDFGPLFGTGTHRVGITDDFSGEIHADLLEDQQTAGVSGSFLWPAIGASDLAVAVSRRDSNAGGLISFDLEHLGRRVSYGFHAELTTRRFAQTELIAR